MPLLTSAVEVAYCVLMVLVVSVVTLTTRSGGVTTSTKVSTTVVVTCLTLSTGIYMVRVQDMSVRSIIIMNVGFIGLIM